MHRRERGRNCYGRELNDRLGGGLLYGVGKRREVGLLNKRGHIGRIIMGVPLLILLFFVMAGYVGAAAVLSKLKDVDRSGAGVSSFNIAGETLSESINIDGENILLLDGFLKYYVLHNAVAGGDWGLATYQTKKSNEGVSDEKIKKERKDYDEFLKSVGEMVGEGKCMFFEIRCLTLGGLTSTETIEPFYFVNENSGAKVKYSRAEESGYKNKYRDKSLIISNVINNKKCVFNYYYGGCLK